MFVMDYTYLYDIINVNCLLFSVRNKYVLYKIKCFHCAQPEVGIYKRKKKTRKKFSFFFLF